MIGKVVAINSGTITIGIDTQAMQYAGQNNNQKQNNTTAFKDKIAHVIDILDPGQDPTAKNKTKNKKAG